MEQIHVDQSRLSVRLLKQTLCHLQSSLYQKHKIIQHQEQALHHLHDLVLLIHQADATVDVVDIHLDLHTHQVAVHQAHHEEVTHLHHDLEVLLHTHLHDHHTVVHRLHMEQVLHHDQEALHIHLHHEHHQDIVQVVTHLADHVEATLQVAHHIHQADAVVTHLVHHEEAIHLEVHEEDTHQADLAVEEVAIHPAAEVVEEEVDEVSILM